MRVEPFAKAIIRSSSLFAVALTLILINLSASLAQQAPRTLFEMLFGSRRSAEQQYDTSPPAPQQRMKPTKPKRAPKPARQAAPSLKMPEVEAIEKKPDAKKILVVGDFTASGLAEGLAVALSANADLIVADKTKGSSGFVRSDHFDWPANIASITDAENPAAIVVMIGSNDRQTITGKGVSMPPRSPEWMNEYQSRVDAFTTAITAKNVPLIWVGQPSFKPKGMSQDMLSLNETYRQTVEKAGGTFIDVWDGFIDDDGNFTQTGFDVNGQTARLRANDGINLTAAGKRKLAFYVEKPLQALFGGGEALPPAPETKAPDKLKPVDRIAPVSLRDVNRDMSGVLLGGDVASGASPKGSTPPTAVVPGRADNFSWPRQ